MEKTKKELECKNVKAWPSVHGQYNTDCVRYCRNPLWTEGPIMREIFQNELSHIFQKHLRKERYRLSLTQEQMSDRLELTLRAYANLEHGQTSCSALTLVMFLLFCCEDPMQFLMEIKEAFRDAYAAV